MLIRTMENHREKLHLVDTHTHMFKIFEQSAGILAVLQSGKVQTTTHQKPSKLRTLE